MLSSREIVSLDLRSLILDPVSIRNQISVHIVQSLSDQTIISDFRLFSSKLMQHGF